MRKLERPSVQMKMEVPWTENDGGGVDDPALGSRPAAWDYEWTARSGLDDWTPLRPPPHEADPAAAAAAAVTAGCYASSPTFGYTQKNFHIADGNLYSILSPFQSRKPSSRPSFLRQSTTARAPEDEGSSLRTEPVRAGRSRRQKLKFHQQGVPPQYRTTTSTTSATLTTTSTMTTTTRTEERCRTTREASRDTSSLLERTMAAVSRVSRPVVDEEDEDDAIDLSIASNWDKLGDAFAASHRLRKSRARRSFFEDSEEEDEEEEADDEDDDEDDDDDEEEEGPLNLCLADHAKRQNPKGSVAATVISRVKQELADDEDEAWHSSLHRTARLLVADTKARQRFYDRTASQLHRTTATTTSSSLRNDHHSSSASVWEHEAMDLSFQQQTKRASTTHLAESLLQQSDTQAGMFGDPTSPFKLSRGKKVPHISRMLENMSLWDEDARLEEKRRDSSSRSGKRKSSSASTSQAAVTVSTARESSPAKPPDVYVSTADFMPNVSPVTADPTLAPTASSPGYFVFVPATLVARHSPAAATTSASVASVPAEMEADGRETVPIRKTSSTSKLEARPRNKATVEGLRHSRSGTVQRSKHQRGIGAATLIHPTAAGKAGDPPCSSANDISICKFKLIKGVQPMLEEKKSFYVAMPRTSHRTASGGGGEEQPQCATSTNMPATSQSPQKSERFRTYKIHVGSQEELGRKLAAGKKSRRRSRKALVREKLEARFRDQGFLIKTQQVSSAEGAVYCKFRQLKKFTRYLFKSWRHYLPKDLEELSTSQSAGNIPSVLVEPGVAASLSLPDIPSLAAGRLNPTLPPHPSPHHPGYHHPQQLLLCSPSMSRCSSMSGTSGLGTSILTDSGLPDSASTFVDSAASVANLSSVDDDMSMVTDATDFSDSCVVSLGVSPCPSTSSLPCTSLSSASIT